MDNRALSEDEMQLWHLWKCTFKKIFGRVVKDMSEVTGLSEGDFGILATLVEVGNGELRQQELERSMEWTKSRLSHHLKRMEQRELIQREGMAKGVGVRVLITPQGESALETARPIIEKSIRKFFLNHLTDQDTELIIRLAERVDKELLD